MSYYEDPYGRPSPGPPAGYDQPAYDRPPYERGPYSAPPPMARPPPGPPPPLPAGWHQEWEPNMRRAFWVEDATGRAQWEPPYGPPPDQGYYDGSRSVPPPEPQGGYYAPPPGPPGGYDNRGYDQGGYQPPQEKKSNAGKYLAAGAAGLAMGGLAGAFIEHERDEDHEEDDIRDAREDGYDDGREDQQEYDEGW
ncbi:uncharacterized protein N7498_007723 [Penicillium cinerascens]|uniref:WW domain-containing protein n=1 Tax=Penicillium cinerascens TaxID=70096 RepID=A0A9W9JM66_9EURO|nr:uncharacterized protein N7498_007723 [Penicillium cinerascens]KAJ5198606.1 hypothetical protein N7498_007723 [Penicillium cinerascens]